MQIGWCTLATPFNHENGVGDDASSFSYDGLRVKKWNRVSSDFGQQWKSGDVIGTLIDLESQEISFWRNHNKLGIAFSNIPIGPNMAYFPALTMKQGERVLFNFGQLSLTNRTENCCSISEPECQYQNFY